MPGGRSAGHTGDDDADPRSAQCLDRPARVNAFPRARRAPRLYTPPEKANQKPALRRTTSWRGDQRCLEPVRSQGRSAGRCVAEEVLGHLDRFVYLGDHHPLVEDPAEVAALLDDGARDSGAQQPSSDQLGREPAG